MNKFKNFIALYFTLSRKESNGFMILCFLLLIFIFAPFIGRALFSSGPTVSLSDQQKLDSFVVLLNNTSAQSSVRTYTYAKEKHPVYASFNPNHASEEEMTKAGVPVFISKRIIKFRSKGGAFRTKEDVKKIYGLSESTYQHLYSYIQLPDKTEKTKSFSPLSGQQKKTTEPLRFDLNQADSLRLISLKGIGPVFASRILKYKNKLGGYVSMEQLKEVYGMDSTAIIELNKYGYIEKNFIPEKININSKDESPLQAHPYIGKRTSKMIVTYRSQHGNFSSVEELKKIRSIPEQSYSRMWPYLTVE